MKYKVYPVVSKEDYQDKCIEAVTGESKIVRAMIGLTPLFFNLALATSAVGIATSGLRASGLLKRSYHKRNKKYWKTKSKKEVKNV